MIDKQVFVNRVAILQCNTNTQYLLSGNITPHEWYQKFTNNRGIPDLSLMSVLSEIVYWYRPKRIKDPNTMAVTYVNKFSGDAWQTSYEHFEKKFNFNREKIRRIFVKLEQMGICAREFRTVKLKGQTYNNRLFIHLSSEFLNSCTDNKRQISDYESCNASFSAPQNEGGSPHFEGDYIIDIKNKNININKSRSIKSNFSQNSFFKEEEGEFRAQTGSATVPPQLKASVLELKDFYPLSKSDADYLQAESGRAFTLNAMNEILLSMSKRVKDCTFESKERFLNYMKIAFVKEMRDAVKISNTDFKIKSNRTPEEITVRQQEDFLGKIESGYQVCPEWRLKKKLCLAFERDKAYKLLKSYKNGKLENNIFKIYLHKHIELTENDHQIILEKIKVVYEDTNYDTKLEIIMPALCPELTINNKKGRGDTPCFSKRNIEPAGTWNKIRKALISYYGDAGEVLDMLWFSNLKATEDKQAKEIILKPPTEFIASKIEQDYLAVIERLTNIHRYKVSLC